MVEYKVYFGMAKDEEGKPSPGSFQRILDHLESVGEPRPNPVASIAFTAEEDGVIKSLLVIQPIPLVEPVKAEPGYGEHIAVLFERAKEFLLKAKAPRVIAHTSHPAMKRMLQRVGHNMTDEFYDMRPEYVRR